MGKNYTALSNGQCILLRCIFVAIQFHCFTDYALYFARVRPKRGSELPMQQLTGAPEKSFIYLAIDVYTRQFQYIVIQPIGIYDISCGIYPKSCIL